MKFYLASKLENADMVKRVAAVLKAAGHTQTYDWTEHGSVQNKGEDVLRQVGEAERKGVMDADMVIVILPGGRGTHTELGIALGSKCEDIIICAETEDYFKQDDRTCAFYWPYVVTRVVGSIDEWLSVILSRARAKQICTEYCG